jgi:predicted nucleic acid-binding protein
MFEILHPIHHRKLTRHEKYVRGFFRQLRVLPLDAESAEEAARMMGGLLRVGRQVNALDVLIAGTAVANAADKIITSDSDYEQIAMVSDLKVEILK